MFIGLSASCQPPRTYCAWHIERLESRLLLTDNVWTSADGGSYGIDGNWSLGHVPTASEDAKITLAGDYSVTLAPLE